MGCRCQERHSVLTNAVRKVARGDVAGAARSIKTVVRSTVSDGQRLAQQAAARLRPTNLKR